MDMTDQYPYRYEPVPPPAPQPAPSAASAAPAPKRRGLLFGLGSAAIAAALVVGGVAVVNSGGSSTVAGSGSITDLRPVTPGGGSPGSGSTTPGTGGTSHRTTARSGIATASQQVGVVTVVSTLKYQQAQSAGTGMVLSSDGEILTNNHVINGATSIVVTVESTGTSYRADVVGTAPTSDVAVLKLRNASGLRQADLAAKANSNDVHVGDTVVGVGNAGGTGNLTAAAGKITALNQSITAADQAGQDPERLTGLIQISAKIIAGDSGGPLYDSVGKIIGIDTAASAVRTTANSSAYAIPIDQAIGIADQIESGVQTASIHQGLPGFLGVGTRPDGGAGALVSGLLDGGPAGAAGITPRSVITAVDGKSVTSPQSLRALLVGHGPGAKVTVTWTDPSGRSQTATVTLATGPAD
ncbi:MAG: S1C family serine protease [Jatrophihabitans sp.]